MIVVGFMKFNTQIYKTFSFKQVKAVNNYRLQHKNIHLYAKSSVK